MIRLAGAVAAIVLLLATWLAMASLVFIWVNGFWSDYPWPDKLWMWIRYAIEAWGNTIVHRWLLISGTVTALPPLLCAYGLVRNRWRSQGSKPAVYGKTEWATERQRSAGGIASTKRPF